MASRGRSSIASRRWGWSSSRRGHCSIGRRRRASRSWRGSPGAAGSTSSTPTSGRPASTPTTAPICCAASRSSARCCRCRCRRSCPRSIPLIMGTEALGRRGPRDASRARMGPGAPDRRRRRPSGHRRRAVPPRVRARRRLAAHRHGLAPGHRPQARCAGAGHRRCRSAGRPAPGAACDRRWRSRCGGARAARRGGQPALGPRGRELPRRDVRPASRLRGCRRRRRHGELSVARVVDRSPGRRPRRAGLLQAVRARDAAVLPAPRLLGLRRAGVDRAAVGRQLEVLLADAPRRAELGAFGRRTVEERFSLSRALTRQLEIYDDVLARGRRASSADAATAARRALGLELHAHDPRRKRARRRTKESLLAAASRREWAARTCVSVPVCRPGARSGRGSSSCARRASGTR